MDPEDFGGHMPTHWHFRFHSQPTFPLFPAITILYRPPTVIFFSYLFGALGHDFWPAPQNGSRGNGKVTGGD